MTFIVDVKHNDPAIHVKVSLTCDGGKQTKTARLGSDANYPQSKNNTATINFFATKSVQITGNQGEFTLYNYSGVSMECIVTAIYQPLNITPA